MFFHGNAKLIFPAFRIIGKAGTGGALIAYEIAGKDFRSPEIEQEKNVIFAMDQFPQQFVAKGGIPSHQGTDFGEKDRAGDFAGISPLRILSAPAKGIFFFLAAGTYSQLFFFGMDQDLNVFRLGKLTEAGHVQIDLIPAESEGRFVGGAKKAPRTT